MFHSDVISRRFKNIISKHAEDLKIFKVDVKMIKVMSITWGTKYKYLICSTFTYPWFYKLPSVRVISDTFCNTCTNNHLSACQ